MNKNLKLSNVTIIVLLSKVISEERHPPLSLYMRKMIRVDLFINLFTSSPALKMDLI